MKHALRTRLLILSGAIAGLALIVFGCSDDRSLVAPQEGGPQTAATPGNVLDLAHAEIQNAVLIQEAHTPDLMARSGVVGTAVGLDVAGAVGVQIFVEDAEDLAGLPAEIDGLPVEAIVTGKLVARKGGGSGNTGQLPQAPPIKLGTSGGWRYDLANGYCCGGTLGCLVQSGGTQYVLSNYHVLYADIVNGGNGRTAQPGDPVIQPGLIDVGCNANNSINVANLVSGGGSLPSANVDAGIAAVIAGQVSSTGEILNVGVPSSTTLAASVGLAVKKMGRTTGLSRASVSGLNGSVNITYENECAGGTAFTKTFTGQIIFTNSRCGFLGGGDSGSLAVQDVTTNPRPVALLFAGSVICSRSAIAIGNPINDVLNFYGGMSVVGN